MANQSINQVILSIFLVIIQKLVATILVPMGSVFEELEKHLKTIPRPKSKNRMVYQLQELCEASLKRRTQSVQ